MKPLTELDLRMALKGSDARRYAVPFGTVATPSAMEYLKMRQVELVYEEEAAAPQARPSAAASRRWDFSDPVAATHTAEGEKPKELFFGPDGGHFDHKPEALTHLKGRQLVYKDHPVIIFRGKLDTLSARILEAQICGQQMGRMDYVADLQEILEFSRRLLVNELRGEETEDFFLLGLSADDLRERSHHPEKYFGHRHILADYRMGPLCVALNTLRALVREVELSAAAAFKDAEGRPTRDDVIRALNRLSSLFYILMFKYLPKNFQPESSGI